MELIDYTNKWVSGNIETELERGIDRLFKNKVGMTPNEYRLQMG